jgi:hypothetical protein
VVLTPNLSKFADSLGAGTLAVHALAGVALVGPHVGLSILVHHSLHVYALVRHCTAHISYTGLQQESLFQIFLKSAKKKLTLNRIIKLPNFILNCRTIPKI